MFKVLLPEFEPLDGRHIHDVREVF